MRRLAHIIHPVGADAASARLAAQPITFETMKVAREYARGQVEVRLCSAQYPEARPVVPEEFQLTPDLNRSILDVGAFPSKRKLPVLADVLDRLAQASEAEYLIYTHADTAVLPHFYLAVDKFIEAGHDAFVIHRRAISDQYQRLDQIPLMYAEIGQPQEGHDCFVFRRDVYPHYKLGLVCVGRPEAERALLWNLACHGKNFRAFQKTHVTFHIGQSEPPAPDECADYQAHQKRELVKILAELKREFGPFHQALAGKTDRQPLWSRAFGMVADLIKRKG